MVLLTRHLFTTTWRMYFKVVSFKEILECDPNQKMEEVVSLVPFGKKFLVATTHNIYEIDEKVVKEVEFIESSN